MDFGITSITADVLKENPLVEENSIDVSKEISSVEEGSKLENNSDTTKEESLTCLKITHDEDESCEDDEQYYDCYDSVPVEETSEHEKNTTDSHGTFVTRESEQCCDIPCVNCESGEHNVENSKKHIIVQEQFMDSLDCKPSKSTKSKKLVTNKKPSKRKPIDSKSNVSSGENPIQHLVLKVEKVLKEWFTLESVCFIFGEDKVKEMIEERYNHITQWRQSTNTTQDVYFYERYLSICRKLNILELKDNQTDASFKEQVRNPLPDFEKLREETTEMQLKVNMFFKGDKVKFEESAGNVKEGEDSSHEPVLPLVDLHAQKTLRKRIVLDRMRKV